MKSRSLVYFRQNLIKVASCVHHGKQAVTGRSQNGVRSGPTSNTLAKCTQVIMTRAEDARRVKERTCLAWPPHDIPRHICPVPSYPAYELRGNWRCMPATNTRAKEEATPRRLPPACRRKTLRIQL